MKGPIAEGTAGRACGRVGRRRVFWGPQTERSAAPFFFAGTAACYFGDDVRVEGVGDLRIIFAYNLRGVAAFSKVDGCSEQKWTAKVDSCL